MLEEEGELVVSGERRGGDAKEIVVLLIDGGINDADENAEEGGGSVRW